MASARKVVDRQKGVGGGGGGGGHPRSLIVRQSHSVSVRSQTGWLDAINGS